LTVFPIDFEINYFFNLFLESVILVIGYQNFFL